MFKSIKSFKGKSRGDGLLRRYTSRNDVCSLGRSMIEMLGVLAIVGVLSVGGIAGYSKAMQKFKIDKAIGEYSVLIFGLIDQIESFHSITGSLYVGVIDVAIAAGLVPNSWNKLDAISINDAYGNRLQLFVNTYEKVFVIDFYLGGTTKHDDDKVYSDNFSAKLCEELFSNLAIPLHNTVKSVGLFRSSNQSIIYHGDNYCAKSDNCLNNMTLSKIHNTCSACTENDACSVVFSF